MYVLINQPQSITRYVTHTIMKIWEKNRCKDAKPLGRATLRKTQKEKVHIISPEGEKNSDAFQSDDASVKAHQGQSIAQRQSGCLASGTSWVLQPQYQKTNKQTNEKAQKVDRVTLPLTTKEDMALTG